MADVVIHGTGKLGQMVYHLLAAADEHRVVGFTADPLYCTSPELLGLPLVPFPDVTDRFPPAAHAMLTTLGGLGGSRARRVIFERARDRGYRHLNYVHPSAVVQGEITWGENNIVFPFCTIGFDGVMGDNTVIREKVYLGHDFVLGDHVFIGVGATIGGSARIGSGSYIAMGATLTNDLTLGEDTFVGIGSLLLRYTEPGSKYYGHPARKVEPRPEGSPGGRRAD